MYVPVVDTHVCTCCRYTCMYMYMYVPVVDTHVCTCCRYMYVHVVDTCMYML